MLIVIVDIERGSPQQALRSVASPIRSVHRLTSPGRPTTRRSTKRESTENLTSPADFCHFSPYYSYLFPVISPTRRRSGRKGRSDRAKGHTHAPHHPSPSPLDFFFSLCPLPLPLPLHRLVSSRASRLAVTNRNSPIRTYSPPLLSPRPVPSPPRAQPSTLPRRRRRSSCPPGGRCGR